MKKVSHAEMMMKNVSNKDSLKPDKPQSEGNQGKFNNKDNCIAKTFVPCSIGFLLLNVFLWGLSLGLLLMIILVCCKVIDFGTTFDYSVCIVLALADMYLLFVTINFSFGFIIHLRNEDVYTHGDFYPKFIKFQYKCSANYKDIESAKIVFASLNSKKEKIYTGYRSPTFKFLELTLNNGRKRRFTINYYSKKQFLKMLNIINYNMRVSGNTDVLNIDEIMMEWHSLISKKDKQIDYLL